MVADFGGLHGAFNNAGVLPAPQPLHEISIEALERIIDVDLKGVFDLHAGADPAFSEIGRRRIVNTASVAGLIADPNMSVYVAAKHAVIGLTKAAAVEYARNGIRVNASCAGPRRHADDPSMAGRPGFREMFFQHNIIGRAAQPEEIAGAVLHLCSDGVQLHQRRRAGRRWRPDRTIEHCRLQR